PPSRHGRTPGTAGGPTAVHVPGSPSPPPSRPHPHTPSPARAPDPQHLEQHQPLPRPVHRPSHRITPSTLIGGGSPGSRPCLPLLAALLLVAVALAHRLDGGHDAGQGFDDCGLGVAHAENSRRYSSSSAAYAA